ncbi:MAG: lamin tail domain-containing protein [Flavobacteriaceae bacterium]|nr:lamin tail domain-containing protein [Flavobacteriaceae bacterium]
MACIFSKGLYSFPSFISLLSDTVPNTFLILLSVGSSFLVPVDFDKADTFAFKSKDAYNNGDVLTVLYSTTHSFDATIDPADWTDITSNFDISTGNNSGYGEEFIESQEYEFNGLSGVGYVAFRYIGGATLGITTSMQIDDIRIADADDNTCEVVTAAPQFSEVSFVNASTQKSESSVTYSLEVEINRSDANVDTTVDVVLTSDNADAIGGYTTQTVVFPAGSDTVQTASITITNNDVVNDNVVLTFELQNLVGGANAVIVADAKDFTLTISDDDTVATGSLMISEIADPNDDAGARFIELYNSSDEDIELEGWSLRRYTNDKAEFTSSSVVTLEAFTLAAGSTYVLSENQSAFEAAYTSVVADMYIGSGGVSGSNGDDNIELLNPAGEVIDVFGVPGEDGSGTCHEFEDGRAVRNSDVAGPSPVFDPSQWTIKADSSVSDCVENSPVNTTDGIFTPGSHNE